MKILLVYANTYPNLAPAPLGLSMIARAAHQAGHAVELLDLMFARNPDKALAQALARSPALVGFSLRNLDNQCIRKTRSFVPDFRRWVAQANTVAPTLIGGSAFTAMPAALFEHLGASYGLAGQADREFVSFLEELAAGRQRFCTPGLVWREDGLLRRNPPRLDGYGNGGSIDWSFIDLSRYRKSHMPAAVITKTGCAHRCLFCDVSTCFGADFAPRDPERILDDLMRDARVHELHHYPYFFVDACFNEPVDWTKSLLEGIVRAGVRIGYYAIVEPTGSLDRELVALLRRSGCLMVTSLLGSGDDHMLAATRRPFTADQAFAAFEIFEDFQLPYIPQLLLGGPGETEETVKASLAFLHRLDPLSVQIDYGLRIYPGAGLRDVALAEGAITPETDLIAPTFYLSPELDRAALEACIRHYRRWHWPRLGQWAMLLARTMLLRR